MSVTINIDQNSTKQIKYDELIPQIKSLIDPSLPAISNLSNIIAALKQSFSQFSWVGFYLQKNNKLYLGPFQGKVACSTIELGKGVCGTSAQNKNTIIVQDVNEFPGHIYCDEDSKSEIVVPLIINDGVIGVLDIDSDEFSTFDKTDKIYLEKLVSIILDNLEFSKIIV